MAIIEKIRSLKGVGILADKTAKETAINFLKVNLIYGFNGSGKSTLSRVFACLQKGHAHSELPDGCSFEIELNDGTIYGASSKFKGLEERVCVFNTDFISDSLHWDHGTANSIFYISQEQADLVAQLKEVEKDLPAKRAALEGAAKTAKASNKAFSTYCTERAKTVHNARRLGTRKYEAPRLKQDYASEIFDGANVLPPEKLATLQDVVSRTAPPPPLDVIEFDLDNMKLCIRQAAEFADLSLGALVLDELEQHPKMVPWLKEGHEYHVQNGLQTCLLCQSTLTDTRKEQLAAALDDKLSDLIDDIRNVMARLVGLRGSSALNGQTLPKPTELDPSLQPTYANKLKCYISAAAAAKSLLDEAISALAKRLEQPTHVVSHTLPPAPNVTATVDELAVALTALNVVVAEHNTAGKQFAERQNEASVAILRHFLAEGYDEFCAMKNAALTDDSTEADAFQTLQALEQKIVALKAQVRAHGPAAPKITKLVHDYLGHKELTIVTADDGYSLHRNGKPMKGPPSEGEKTAIALCYFLTTLEAEGRLLKDLIVVIDDPISSLDTKAMNYACALVRKKLEKVGQLFVLTHNQHCMNEFKKAWKSSAYPRKTETLPSARLLYMNVQFQEGSATRFSQIVEMSELLREYDSEYHFLCRTILEFEAAGTDHSPNLLLMPNAMRRVLEIFLAFKVPGSAPIGDKLKKLTERHPELDAVGLVALERLSQVESHSDNLDDLIEHSPMIVEEVRQKCSALLGLMAVADEAHTAAIRKQCKVA